MSALTDRASLLREFFRLVNADSNDADMTEHDADGATLEGAYEALDVGLRNAQLFALRIGRGARWLTTSSALTVSGTFPNRKAALPSDFLRLDSDPQQRRSGLKTSAGFGWGREIDIDMRDKLTGNYFWVREEADGTYAIYFAKGAAPPAGLVADYYARADTLADSVDADFPIDDRPLIVAEAAEHASTQSWFPGDGEAFQKLSLNAARARKAMFQSGRLTRQNRRFQVRPTRGRHIL